MTIRSCDYTDAMENALMTAENHGKAYRLLSTISAHACKEELMAELKRHHVNLGVSIHAQITLVQARTIANDVTARWRSDNFARIAPQQQLEHSASTTALKAELKALLLKHNAAIGFTFGEGSDTHGIYDERIVICIDDYEAVSVDGYGLGPEDL